MFHEGLIGNVYVDVIIPFNKEITILIVVFILSYKAIMLHLLKYVAQKCLHELGETICSLVDDYSLKLF